jgi:thiol-disulfide isomerase/thioredoxin
MRMLLVVLTLFSICRPLHAQTLKLLDSYPSFAGEAVSLQSVLGSKPVYLKFWATWCLDCRRELPSLEKTYQQYRHDIAMFAVNLNINETDDAIRQLQQESGLSMPIVIDQHGSIASNFNFVGTPFHVLINTSGEVVYTTYRDDAKLAFKLKQLAKGQEVEVSIAEPNELPQQTEDAVVTKNGTSLVYFSAVWCDTYMQDVEASIATNCINAIQTINQLFATQPQLNMQAYVTHLWTQDGDLAEYQQRLKIPYVVTMDKQNKLFQHYQAKGYPTVIVLKQGKEVVRFSDFSQPQQVLGKLQSYLN